MTDPRPIRRVVTGPGADGRGSIVADGPIDPIVPARLGGAAFYRMWSADNAPALPEEHADPEAGEYFPPVGGFRFGVFTVPPEGTASGRAPRDGRRDAAAEARELDELLPGLSAAIEPGTGGMHTTASIDFIVVLQGTVVLDLDDGSSVRLSSGDTVIQNGTRHRWRNPTGEPAVLAMALVGAPHAALPSRSRNAAQEMT